MPIRPPDLDKLRISQPQPASAILRGMEFQNRSRRTDIAEDRNAIMREGQDLRKQGLELEKKNSEARIESNAILAGFRGATAEQQNELYKAAGGKAEIEWVGEKIQMTYPDGLVVLGPQKYMEEYAQKVSEDPNWSTNPERARHMRAWAVARGISFGETPTEKPDKPVYDMKTIYGPEGKTKQVSIQKGTNYTPPEGWTLTKPSTAKGSSNDKNLLVAAQAIEIDPERVRAGDLNKEEAELLAKKYSELFGSESLLEMIFSGSLTKESSENNLPALRFDEKGDLIPEGSEITPQGKTIIRKKIE